MKHPMKRFPAPAEAEACRLAMVAAMRPYADKLGPEGMLAVAAALVGQLVAMQDQRKTTPAMAMELVTKNIQDANQHAIDTIARMTGGKA